MRIDVKRACLGLVAALGFPIGVSAADLVVMSTGGAAVAQQRFAAQSHSGTAIQFIVAMPAALQAKLAAGEEADVIVAPAQAIDALERTGKIVAGTRTPVARVGVGVAVKRGAPHPEISTPEALRAALLSAHSIVHPNPEQAGSVAGKAIAAMLVKLGIAEMVKQKLTYRQAIAGGVEMVAKGEVALGLFNISEILPIDGAALVGPLPRELQSYITFTAAAVTSGKALPAVSKGYIAGLKLPFARRHWEAAGLEPVD